MASYIKSLRDKQLAKNPEKVRSAEAEKSRRWNETPTGKAYRAAKGAKEKQARCEARKASRPARALRRKQRKSAAFAAWRQKNIEHNRERIRNWKQNNSARVRASHGKRRSAAECAPAEFQAVAAFYEHVRTADRIACYLCGKNIPSDERTVDHVIPLAKGGKHARSNLAAACRACNCSKRDLLPEEIGLLL